MTTQRTVAVLGFHSDSDQEAALRRTFDQFAHPDHKLLLRSADREGELHSLSLEAGDLPIACIHADYEYPSSYLDALVRGVDDVTADAVWTTDRAAKPGPLGDGSNPDIYQSLIPAHVFRLLYGRHDRHIAVDKRGERARGVRVHLCDGPPVKTRGALPNRLHQLNGLYWLVDYAHRMDRRCIEAYLDLKKIGREILALDDEAFLAALAPLQLRHLRFFLNTNVAGERAITYIAKHVDLSTVKTALDVGSGYGGLVKALEHRGCAATGLEIMKSLTELAKINLAGRGTTLVGDFLKVELPAEAYDLVTMTDVIEHVADAEQAMARTAEILRPGGYAYIKVPNYRFIDHVREDAHTGLFGITLLRHDPAAAYVKAARNAKYSVGDYHDYDYYIRTFAKYGVSLVRSDNVQSPIEDLPTLLDACRKAFSHWEEHLALAPEMKANIRDHVVGYLRDFDTHSKPRRRWSWPFRSGPEDGFLRDYMTAHWNMFFQKHPG